MNAVTAKVDVKQMPDQVIVNGIELGTRKPLVPPATVEEFQEKFIANLLRPKVHLPSEVSFVRSSSRMRFAAEFRPTNLNNPNEVGWSLLTVEDDPQRSEIVEALEPLCRHRKGKVTVIDSSVRNSFETWLDDHFVSVPEEERPYFALLACSPDLLPFRFQSLFDVISAVGRIHFETVDDYGLYAEKVIKSEMDAAHPTTKSMVAFATQHDGATTISSSYMVSPLVDFAKSEGAQVRHLKGQDATLPKLMTAATDMRPAVVLTASHGLAVPGNDDNLRRQLQGALICGDYDGKAGLLSADKVPESTFFPGSIWIAFACYGAGTPVRSDFFHWFRDNDLLKYAPKADFVAALPCRLLVHPGGPLAFFGHVDPAWVYSFTDPKRLVDDRGWGTRMAPFHDAVRDLLKGATVGYAVKRFNETYALVNSILLSEIERYERDPNLAKNPIWKKKIVDLWMTRNDTQNFVCLGDPAVHPHIV